VLPIVYVAAREKFKFNLRLTCYSPNKQCVSHKCYVTHTLKSTGHVTRVPFLKPIINKVSCSVVKSVAREFF